MTLRLILALLACALQAAALLSSQRPPVPGSDAVAVHAVPVVVATTSSSAPVTSRAPRASRSRAPKASATGAATGDLLDRIALCESGGNTRAVGCGGECYGAFQQTAGSWARYGSGGAILAMDYGTQKAAAGRQLAAEGLRPWPICGRRAAA